MIDFIGLCAENLANADILKVGWPWVGLHVVPQQGTAEWQQQMPIAALLLPLCGPFPALLLALQVMQWIAGYHGALGEFGVEEEDVAFPLGPHSGVTLLISKYVERTVATLSAWLNNIVEGALGAGACDLITLAHVASYRRQHVQRDCSKQATSSLSPRPTLMGACGRQGPWTSFES